MSSPDTDPSRKEKIAATAAQLEEDIDALRNSLGVVARELDRRRHRFTDIPRQLKRQARPIAVATAVSLALGVGLWFWQRSRKRPGRLLSLLPASFEPSATVKAIRQHLAAAITPEAAPTHPVRSSLWKVSTAGVGSAAAVVGKRLASRLVDVDWSTLLANGASKVDAGKDANFGR